MRRKEPSELLGGFRRLSIDFSGHIINYIVLHIS